MSSGEFVLAVDAEQQVLDKGETGEEDRVQAVLMGLSDVKPGGYLDKLVKSSYINIYNLIN